MDAIESSTDRRSFLKRLGVAVGVAVGAIALPSLDRASANTGGAKPEYTATCCTSSCTTCDADHRAYYCSCPTGNYCACFALRQPVPCFTAPC